MEKLFIVRLRYSIGGFESTASTSVYAKTRREAGRTAVSEMWCLPKTEAVDIIDVSPFNMTPVGAPGHRACTAA